MNKTGLVLEGGGMRGVFTCGVLEYFLESDLFFPYIIGVSAGACNACSYLSRQKQRNKKVNISFINDWRYLSFRNLLKTKSLFGMDFIFNEIPLNLVPFDFDTFFSCSESLVIGATDCNTGKPVYFYKDNYLHDKKLIMNILKASSSLPYVAPEIIINDKVLLDGGITDSIPIKRSIKDGHNKNVVILTRNLGYRKTPSKLNKISNIKYRKYPKLVEAINNRYKTYNETIEFIEKLEKENKIYVIRPTSPINVNRLEKNETKLNDLYFQGYNEAKKNYSNILEYINN